MLLLIVVSMAVEVKVKVVSPVFRLSCVLYFQTVPAAKVIKGEGVLGVTGVGAGSLFLQETPINAKLKQAKSTFFMN